MTISCVEGGVTQPNRSEQKAAGNARPTRKSYSLGGHCPPGTEADADNSR
jgi:hypothetical protein